MLKKDLKAAIRQARESRQPVRIGRWTISTCMVFNGHTALVPFSLHYYARPDELRCNLGGVTHGDTLADMILRADRRGDTFAEYPPHSRVLTEV